MRDNLGTWYLTFKNILNVSGVRGGVSTITTRHSKANNKYHPKEYDPELLSLFLAYSDANNLYGESYNEYFYTIKYLQYNI